MRVGLICIAIFLIVWSLYYQVGRLITPDEPLCRGYNNSVALGIHCLKRRAE